MLQPSAVIVSAYWVWTTFIGVEVHPAKDPDCIIAEVKTGPREVVVKRSGIARRAETEPPPEDYPKIVTLAGSAPNAPIFV